MDNERRSQTDRRRRDAGPPRGWMDRRRNSERRLPQAIENDLSADEFERYFGKAMLVAESNAKAMDEAAEVLDRIAQRS